jgi:hypothetical protein
LPPELGATALERLDPDRTPRNSALDRVREIGDDAPVCVAVAPAQFSATTVYAGEVARNGEVVHVVGYGNTVASRTAEPRSGVLRRLLGSPARDGGNAMVLHFPAVPGTMSQSNALDTARCPHLLRDMVIAVEAVPAGGPAPAAVQGLKAVEVFDTGIYTVVLAGDPRDIPAALEQVPAGKRPPLNAALFDWYRQAFPGWPVALCCFNTRDAVKSAPVMWWFQPAYPDWLFAPAVDCHTGAIPDLGADVMTDHWVMLGSSSLHEGMPVRYSDSIPPDVASYLPERVIGGSFMRRMPNGDFLARVEEVRRGRLDVRRGILPTAA